MSEVRTSTGGLHDSGSIGSRRGGSQSAGTSTDERDVLGSDEGMGVHAHMGSGADVGVMAYPHLDVGHGILWSR
jgi:hypothetical protein